MGLFKKEFQIGKYPYIYECSICNSKHPEASFPMDKDDEKELKEEYGITSDLPLFFDCFICGQAMMKPKNYTGKPSKIILNEMASMKDQIFSQLDKLFPS